MSLQPMSEPKALTVGYLNQLGIPFGGPAVGLLLPEGVAKAEVAAPKAEGPQVRSRIMSTVTSL